MDKKSKVWLSIGFTMLIVIAVGLMFANKDTLFQNKVEIKYADGCIEEYVDTKLVSPVCERGRGLAESQEGLPLADIYQEDFGNFSFGE